MFNAKTAVTVLLGLMAATVIGRCGILADDVVDSEISDNSVDSILGTGLLPLPGEDAESNGDGGFPGNFVPPGLENWLRLQTTSTASPLPSMETATMNLVATETVATSPVLSFGIDPFSKTPILIPPPPSPTPSQSTVPETKTPKLDSGVAPEKLEDGTTDNTATTTTSVATKSTTDGRRVLGINPFKFWLVTTTTTTTASTTKSTTRATTKSTTRATTRATTKSTTQATTKSATTKKIPPPPPPTTTTKSTHSTSRKTTTPQNVGPTSSTTTEQNLAKNYTSTAIVTASQMTSAVVQNGISFAPNHSTNGQKYMYRMCGYPAICYQKTCSELDPNRDPLEMCEIPGAKGVFIFFVVIIALAIILGNLLLPLVLWKNKELRTQHNLTKVSLAFADIITGLILLCSVIPNIIRTMESTERELGGRDFEKTNSPEAVIAGAMLTFSAQASLFHLTYLSVERFVAIKWPLWHRFKGPASTSSHIVGIWILALVTACIPAAFKEHFSFRYLPVLFVYILTATGSESNAAGATYLVLTMAVPLAITITFIFLTGIIVWRKMRNSTPMRPYSVTNRYRGDPGNSTITTNGNGDHNLSRKNRKESTKREMKPEVAVFKTLGVMIAGFCLTLLPFIIVVNMFYSGRYDCTTYVVPYAAAFYACMSNSFVNVLVYTVRDEKFRTGLKRVFMRKHAGRWHTTKTKSDTHSTSLSSPHPMRMATVSTGKERWERALVGQ